MDQRRVVLIGDSWMCGLSSRGRKATLGRMLAERVGSTDLLDRSRISRILPEVVLDHLGDIDAFAPDVAFVAVGGADSLAFPAPPIQRWIDKHFPPEWAGVAGLQKRAMYSPDRRKRLRQRAEAFAKMLLKQALVNLFGAYPRVPLEVYETNLRALLDVLARHGTRVVLIGVTPVSHWSSPKSTRSIDAAMAANAAISREYPNTLWAPTRGLVDRWDDYLEDKVHLNPEGHRKVTEGVLAAMRAAGGQWADLTREGSGPAPAVTLDPPRLTG